MSKKSSSLEFKVTSTTPSSSDTEIVVVFQDEGKKVSPPKGRYKELVERLRKSSSFKGATGSVEFLRFNGVGVENVMFVGAGKLEDAKPETFRRAGAAAWAMIRDGRAGEATLISESILSAKGGGFGWLRAFLEGMALAAYRFDRHQTQVEADSNSPVVVHVRAPESGKKSKVSEAADYASAVGESVALTRDWSNEPSNIGTPEFYGAEAKKLAKKYGWKCKVLGLSELKKEKMGLYLCVAAGSLRDPRMVVVEYSPKGKTPKKTIALVGKGVTFDSGGISIKPSSKMEDMKHDMTGAATVMGALLLASKLKVPHRVIGIMGFTENMPSGVATQPGNIITARSGKTVEIVNTDAEGRLVLADLLDYASDLKPDAVVDIATLTGAATVALGKYCAAVMGSNSSLVEELKAAGEESGERLWELPLYDDYLADMKSTVADFRNSCNNAGAGTIRGGIFLKQFVGKNINWAHLDIAATAYDVTHLPYCPKIGSSGLHVRTLARFLENS